MAKKETNPIDLTEKVTLYAPKGAKHHKEGEEVNIHPVLKDKFLSHGFTETAPETDSKTTLKGKK